MGIPELITLIGLGITIVVVGLVILGCLRLSRKFHKSRPKPATGPKPATPPWIWVFLIAIVAMVSYAMADKKAPGQPAQPLIAPWTIFRLAFGAFLVLVGLLYAYVFFTNYDRDASRALKLAQAGDKDGALFEMKNAMDGLKPSAERSNTLGLIHTIREEWPEAYQAFLEAQAIGGRKANFLGNQGVALLKMGRVEEAAKSMDEAYRMAPADAMLASNYGMALAELDRIDEAVSQLEKARKNLKSTLFLNKAIRPIYEQEIALLGEKIEAARARRANQEAS